MKEKIIPRPKYLNQLTKFKDQNFVKVLTGVRRSGKSSLLKLMSDHLINEGVNEDNIIQMNFSHIDYEDMTYRDIYDQVKKRYNGERLYLFFDEIQEVDGWEKAVLTLQEELDCDIYLTGSNAKLLSSELATYLSGRYILVPVFPLDFKEFLNFKNLSLIKEPDKFNQLTYSAYDQNGTKKDLYDYYYEYLRYGGMPEIALTESDMTKEKILEAIYSSVFIRDIEHYLGNENTSLLTRIVRFLASSVGSYISTNKLKNTLTSLGWLHKSSLRHDRIQKLIDACVHAYLFYPVKRYDTQGKKELLTPGKYYIVDTGIRNQILDYKTNDRGHLLENLVFLKLQNDGFKVKIGKIRDFEIDFIATKNERDYYIQVSQSLENPEVLERELRPFKTINNAYKKLIITEDRNIFNRNIDGVEIVNVIDFLLDERILT